MGSALRNSVLFTIPFSSSSLRPCGSGGVGGAWAEYSKGELAHQSRNRSMTRVKFAESAARSCSMTVPSLPGLSLTRTRLDSACRGERGRVGCGAVRAARWARGAA